MKHCRTSVSGTVRDVFAHRFTIETAQGLMLADLTPRGVEQITLGAGDEIMIEGERKPSEIKIHRIRRGGVSVEIEHAKTLGKHVARHGAVDPEAATAAVRAAGYSVVGEPRLRPKHVEVLAIDAGGGLRDLHVATDGTIRKDRPADLAGLGRRASPELS